MHALCGLVFGCQRIIDRDPFQFVNADVRFRLDFRDAILAHARKNHFLGVFHRQDHTSSLLSLALKISFRPIGPVRYLCSLTGRFGEIFSGSAGIVKCLCKLLEIFGRIHFFVFFLLRQILTKPLICVAFEHARQAVMLLRLYGRLYCPTERHRLIHSQAYLRFLSGVLHRVQRVVFWYMF